MLLITIDNIIKQYNQKIKKVLAIFNEWRDRNMMNQSFYDKVDLSDMGEFHKFVLNYDHDELISIIEKNYRGIKNNCIYAPHLGENGCLEFAASLLLYDYILEDLTNIEYGWSNNTHETLLEIWIRVSIAICSAFTGCTPTEFSNMTDLFSYNTSVITRKEFSVVYLYLRDNFAQDIRKMEFNYGNGISTTYVNLKCRDVLKYDSAKIRDFFLEQGLKT